MIALLIFVMIGEVNGPEGPDISPPPPGPPPKILRVTLDDDLPIIKIEWCYPATRSDFVLRAYSAGTVSDIKLHFAEGREVLRTNFDCTIPVPKANTRYTVQAVDYNTVASEWSNPVDFQVTMRGGTLPGIVMPQASSSLPFMPSATISNPPAMPAVLIKP